MATPQTDLRRLDIGEQLAPSGGRVQSMRGFDDTFIGIVDYIVRITYWIWEQKNPGLVHRYYAEDCPIHTLSGPVVGAEQVVQNTIATMQAFPDRTLYADAVLWSGDDEAGFHSSHRITSLMTNLGRSEFGPATGQRARVTTIAHCIVRENRIVEEWLVRDNCSLALQLGLDPLQIAQRQAAGDTDEQTPYRRYLDSEFTRVRSGSGPVRAGLNSGAASEFTAALFTSLWQERCFGRVADYYAERVAFHGPSGRELLGCGEVAAFICSLLACLPDAAVSVDHICCNEQVGGHDVAVRWTLAGHHRGHGVWGAPSNNPVLLLAEAHWRMSDGRIQEEWLVFDEIAVLRQVFRG